MAMYSSGVLPTLALQPWVVGYRAQAMVTVWLGTGYNIYLHSGSELWFGINRCGMLAMV